MVSFGTGSTNLVIMELDIVWGGCLCLGSLSRVQLGLQVIKTDALNSQRVNSILLQELVAGLP